MSAVSLTAAALTLGVFSYGAAEEAEKNDGPVVVELFTSQSCSSCVKANAYFSELAERDGVIAVGWHVDYWDQLQTANGHWRDPYSSPECTERQRRYNKNIRDRSSVYTPQMVINGEAQAVGSARGEVDQLIENARTARSVMKIKSERSNGSLVFDISAAAGGEAFLVTLKPKVKTNIRRGENAGHSFVEINLATEIKPLGAVTIDGARLTAPIPAAGDHCAIIVQEPDQGRIIAAAYCAS